MARHFNSAFGERMQFGIGENSTITSSDITLVVVYRRTDDSSFDVPMSFRSSGGTDHLWLQIEDTGIATLTGSGIGGRSSTFTVTMSDDWVVLAASKPSGTSTPRFHKYVYATDSWTHEDSAGTQGVGTAPGAGGEIATGIFGGFNTPDGYIAAMAVFPAELTDTEIEALPHALNLWHSYSPRGFWIFDQDRIAQPVCDESGSGCNQTSLTGTSVALISAPIGYGHPVVQVEEPPEPPVQADVTYVGGDSGEVSGTSFNLTWPTVEEDDQAVLWWQGQTGVGGFTNPTGFDLIQAFTPGSGSHEVRFYKKTCVGDEDGGSITLTMGGSNKHSAVLSVYRGIDPTDPVDAHAPFDETVSGTSHSCPEVTPDSANAVAVSFVGERLSTGSTDYTQATYTERQQSTSLGGGGATICATSDDGLSVTRSAGVGITPPNWVGTVANNNVVTWSVALRRAFAPAPPTYDKTDDVDLTDDLELETEFDREVSDDSGLVDEVDFVADYVYEFEHDAGLVDDVDLALTMLRTFADVAELSDNVAHAKTFGTTFGEPFGVTDEVTFRKLQFLDEDSDVGLADDLAKQLERPTSSALDLTDETSFVVIRGVSVGDDVNLVDAVTLDVIRGRTFNDRVRLTDAVTRLLARSVEDDAGLVDDLSLTFIRPTDDDVDLSDALGLEVNKGVHDLVGLVDSSTVITTFGRTRNENAGLRDSVLVAAVFGINTSEDVGLTDALVMAQRIGAFVNDDAGLSDALALRVSKGLNESAGVVDSVTRVVDYVRTRNEDVGLVDDVLVGLDFQRAFADAVGLDDAVVMASRFPVSIDDGTGLTDDLLVGIIYGVSISDDITVTDAAAFAETFRRSFRELFKIWDDTSWGWGFNPSLGANNAGLRDSVNLELVMTPNFSEDIGLTDDVEVTIKREVQVSDATGLASSVNLVATIRRTFNDGAGLADGATSAEVGFAQTHRLVIDDHTGLVDTFLKTTMFAIVMDRIEEFWSVGRIEENWRLEGLTSEPGQ